MARPRLGIEQHSGGKASIPRLGDTRRQPGTFLYGRGHSTPSGTGFLSPNAQLVPGRKKVHPHAQDVPVKTGSTGPAPDQHRTSVHPVLRPVLAALRVRAMRRNHE